MKKSIFKSLAVVTLFLVLGTGAYAQLISSGNLPTYSITTPGDTSSLADTVSVGSVMPYYVNYDKVIKGSSLYNASGFAWTVTGATVTLNSNTTGGTLTASPVAATGYYTDTLVYATFPGSTGNATISTAERSNPKFSATAGCDGNTRNLGVNIIALPSAPTIANADTAQGGCTAAANYTVNFNFSSSTVKYPIYVRYTVQYHDLNNVAGGTPATYLYQINNASEHVIIPQSQLVSASNGTTAPLAGRYTVTLGNMWDRISVRATNASSLAVDASAVDAAIMVLPAPATQPIKHIKTI